MGRACRSLHLSDTSDEDVSAHLRQRVLVTDAAMMGRIVGLVPS
jgi:hypothetical protein